VTLVDPAEHLPAVYSGHHHVEQDQVRRLVVEDGEPLVGVPGFPHRVSVHLEIDANEFPDPRVVVDDQDERGSADLRARPAPGAGDEGVEVTSAIPSMPAGRVERRQAALIRPLPDRALRHAEVLGGLAQRQPIGGVVTGRLAPRLSTYFGHTLNLSKSALSSPGKICETL
jgi:hypothetical protein